jgi:hypothetical protein
MKTGFRKLFHRFSFLRSGDRPSNNDLRAQIETAFRSSSRDGFNNVTEVTGPPSYPPPGLAASPSRPDHDTFSMEVGGPPNHRPGRDGFSNDTEVSGPPNYPPPTAASHSSHDGFGHDMDVIGSHNHPPPSSETSSPGYDSFSNGREVSGPPNDPPPSSAASRPVLDSFSDDMEVSGPPKYPPPSSAASHLSHVGFSDGAEVSGPPNHPPRRPISAASRHSRVRLSNGTEVSDPPNHPPPRPISAASPPSRVGFSNGTEVSGPPNYPPPSSAFGRPLLNVPPSSSPSQSLPLGEPRHFLPRANMGSPYAIGTREHNSYPSFDSPPSMNPTSYPPPGPEYPNLYGSSPLFDNQIPPLDDGGQGRSLSAGDGGFGRPPAFLPPPGMTPDPSQYGPRRRTRRASSVGPNMGMGFGVGVGGSVPNMYHRPGGRVTVRFRLKGEQQSGISVAEALNRERLSQSHGYMMRDIAPDMPGSITLRVRVRCLPLPSPHYTFD